MYKLLPLLLIIWLAPNSVDITCHWRFCDFTSNNMLRKQCFLCYCFNFSFSGKFFFLFFFLKKQTELNVNFLNFCLNILVKGDSDFLCYVARLVGHTVMILNLGVRSIKLYKCERSCKYSPGSYFLFKLNITTASRYVFFLK